MQDRRDRLVFTSPFFRVILLSSGQRIWFAVLCSWSIEDFEVDAGELLRPARLPSVEDLGGGEVLEVLVVRVHLNLVGRSFTVPPPVFEGVHNCQKFLVVYFVVDFCGLELPTVEGDGVKAVVIISLGQNGSQGKV